MRRTLSTVAAGLLLALATAHAAEPQAHRETLAGINVPKGTVYVPKESAFCASCINCPNLATEKARAACRKRYCGKCPDNIIFAAEQSITSNVGGNDILKLTKDDAVINGDLEVTGDTQIDGDLGVDGESNLQGDVNVGCPASATGGDLQVCNEATFGGDATFNSDVSIGCPNGPNSGTLNACGDVNIGGDLNVTGEATFQTPVKFDDVTVNGRFAMDGFGDPIPGGAPAVTIIAFSDNAGGCTGTNPFTDNKFGMFQVGTGGNFRFVFAYCGEVNGNWAWREIGGSALNPSDA